VRLDLFRAIALFFLFLEALPGSAGSLMSLHAYGFSDATVVFMFVFGYTAGAVYGAEMRERGLVLATARIYRRAWTLYVAHVFLFVFYVMEITYAARFFDNPHYLDTTRISALLQQPIVTLVQGLLLNFQITHMEVLALYIVLLVGFVPMLWLLLRSPLLGLAASATVYALAREHGWTLPAYPSGTWVLNPFAWQLLFAASAWLGTGGGRMIERWLGSRLVLGLAVAYLAFALAVVMVVREASTLPHLPAWLSDATLPDTRTNLGFAVLLHVIAIGVVAVRLVPRDLPALDSRLLRPVLLCGVYSLPIFCLSVFLAFAGWSVSVQWSNGPLTHAALACGGVALMIAVAVVVEWLDQGPERMPRPSRTVATQPTERRAAARVRPEAASAQAREAAPRRRRAG
jgi:hypothetical protein